MVLIAHVISTFPPLSRLNSRHRYSIAFEAKLFPSLQPLRTPLRLIPKMGSARRGSDLSRSQIMWILTDYTAEIWRASVVLSEYRRYRVSAHDAAVSAALQTAGYGKQASLSHSGSGWDVYA